MRTTRGRPARARRRPRVGVLLALVVLVPTVGMGILAYSGASQRWDESRLSAQVVSQASALEHVMATRAAISDETVLSAAIASAAARGVTSADLGDLFGVDVTAELQRARRQEDLDEYLRHRPSLAAELRQIRSAVDHGRVGAGRVKATFAALSEIVEQRWDATLAEIRDSVASSTSLRQAGALRAQIGVLDETFTALTAVKRIGNFANLIIFVGQTSPANVTGLLEARGRFAAAKAAFLPELGPDASAAWLAWRADPSTQRAELVTGAAVDLALTPPGVDPPIVPTVYRSVLTDGIGWIAGFTRVVTAAAHDLADIAGEQQRAANRSMVTQAAASSLLAVVALGAGIVLAQAVVRPLRRLEGFAHAVGGGEFEHAPPPLAGPREVARTIGAIADMSATVAAVEAYVIELARDPESTDLDRPLPGQTGRALQTTVNHLRQSIRADAVQREKLEEVATHDGLTGVLNRAAALDAVERDLARARRDKAAFAMIFVDLDGLKAINDSYGHEVGDRAIRLTAEALRASTRRSDIVARLGGDEFIVGTAGGTGRSRGMAQAERIRRAVARQVLTFDGERITVRCSVGVAIADADDTADSVIRKADAALYRSKARGRNQVTAFDAAPDSLTPV